MTANFWVLIIMMLGGPGAITSGPIQYYSKERCEMAAEIARRELHRPGYPLYVVCLPMDRSAG